jgi:MFS family permease
VSGFGAGLVNPPLASTAIGVVPPQRAGMASGINTTFRQIGIAAGIAALGSIFTSAMERNLAHAGGVVGAAAPSRRRHPPRRANRLARTGPARPVRPRR